MKDYAGSTNSAYDVSKQMACHTSVLYIYCRTVLLPNSKFQFCDILPSYAVTSSVSCVCVSIEYVLRPKDQLLKPDSQEKFNDVVRTKTVDDSRTEKHQEDKSNRPTLSLCDVCGQGVERSYSHVCQDVALTNTCRSQNSVRKTPIKDKRRS
ncbi:hypothetical protein ScPMuIL_011432 [Solemya velum]